ncbi:DUF4177 domain-containing protein [Paraclostridium bifermentans]|uniref:DUF4177 domain-containing protein n=2 Tax=Paraclostridium bifermentans TaxID=1490 RepID=UPI00115AD164|nr:DUF4177 domain-containing protein [Paraclostridium bifermentans]TQO58114.1 DUF4177 domain-containing protein [Paraclostridium bifermentans]
MNNQNEQEKEELTNQNEVKQKPKKKGKIKEAVKNNKKFTILVSLLFLMTISLFIIVGKSMAAPQWSYKVVEYYSDQLERSGSGAMNQATINIPEKELNELGKQGWELVSSHIENETAYPNFGNSEYVTGLQPNVRPQKVVLLFKKAL